MLGIKQTRLFSEDAESQIPRRKVRTVFCLYSRGMQISST
ncbi:hypothetical protein HMPREF0971_02135 [Segatella oris F0302]|uniref:Uncharacterized protein n=1 Tax=Segatella oris F0302 TaxID=649760 RepID=D1QT12_9BACT|nr:hypothetical protein HMPREF0971_02135 [Segatella oris F0302]